MQIINHKYFKDLVVRRSLLRYTIERIETTIKEMESKVRYKKYWPTINLDDIREGARFEQLVVFTPIVSIEPIKIPNMAANNTGSISLRIST